MLQGNALTWISCPLEQIIKASTISTSASANRATSRLCCHLSLSKPNNIGYLSYAIYWSCASRGCSWASRRVCPRLVPAPARSRAAIGGHISHISDLPTYTGEQMLSSSCAKKRWRQQCPYLDVLDVLDAHAHPEQPQPHTK